MKLNSFIQWLVLILIGIGIPLFVVFRNIFPHFSYALNQSLEFGLGLTPKTVAGQDYLVAALGTQYPFDTIKIALTVDKSTAQSAKQLNMQLARDFIVSTYPVGEAIDDADTLKKLLFDGNPAGIANGSIYSYGESVYVISRGQYYPVIAPVVFESLGYHWEQLLPLDSQSYSQLKAAERITYMSAHPDGTLLKTRPGKYYIVWEGQRRPIKDATLIENVWRTYYWIDLADEKINFFASCQASFNSRGKTSCTMDYDPQNLNKFGNVYIVKLEPAVAAKLQAGRSVFETKLNWDKQYLKFSLGQIKNKLYMRYAGYFL